MRFGPFVLGVAVVAVSITPRAAAGVEVGPALAASSVSLALPGASRQGATSVADTQWTADGRPVCVASGVQGYPSIVTDGEGGAFIAWADSRGGWRVGLQHVLADGRIASAWPDSGLLISAAAQFLGGPTAVADGSGGVYAVWANGMTHGSTVLAQHVDGSANVVPGWPALGLPVAAVENNQYRSRAATDAAGGVYVVWEDDRNGVDNPDLYIQRLQADGSPAPGWDPVGTPLCTSAGYQYRAALCPDASGGVLAAWVDGYQVSAMRMTSSGTPAPGWPLSGVVVRSDTTYVRDAVVASDSAGGCYLSWVGTCGGGQCVFLQHLDAAGQVALGWETGGRPAGEIGPIQDLQAIAASATGAYAAWWEDGFLHVTRLTSAGTRPSSWPADGLVLTGQESLTLDTSVLLTDADEDLLVIWSQCPSLSPTGADVVATRLTPDGTLAPGWPTEPVAICSAGGDQARPVAVTDDGGCTIAWGDGRNGVGDIYAARLTVDGTVPTLLTLVDVSVQPGHVRLRWYAGGGRISTTVVYRRTATSDWTGLDELTADGTGILAYEDHAVQAGSRYCYRLATPAGADASLTDDIWVDVPSWGALALAGPQPNPATGPIAVTFTLATDAPAVLELLDVSGRRVLTRDVGTLGAGRHVLSLSDSAQFPNGVYWLRLTQGGMTASARCTVSR
jgi:hypothetical protein